jgi:dienelactone hydrolase
MVFALTLWLVVVMIWTSTVRAQEKLGTQVMGVAIPQLRRLSEQFMMPVPGVPGGIDVLKVEVQRPGKHPLAILTHGTAPDSAERARVTPWHYLSQATWFARRGYVVLVVVRRGYGRSGGKQEDTEFGECDAKGKFVKEGQASAEDLRAAANYAAQMPEVDASTIISVGVSAGGFAQVALSADPPPGLKAAISFAGGRGSDGKGHNCNLTGLLSAFDLFGQKSRLPMLWIYAENDHWFPPAMAREFDAAFKKGGGDDEFEIEPPFGDEGHHFFDNVRGWSPIVGRFLQEHALLGLSQLIPEPPIPPVVYPPGLGDKALAAFPNFLVTKPFATDGAGGWVSSTGQLSGNR